MLEPVKNLENVFYVDLENSDLDEVVKSLGLGLLNDEMENVKKYFSKEGRKPTDVELQAIDQHGLNIVAINLLNLFWKKLFLD